MVEASRFARVAVEADVAQPHQRVKDILKEIRGLVQELPADVAREFLDQIVAAARPISAPRAGGVLDAVVRIVPRQQSWTIAQIKSEVAAQGVSASPKEVYNAVGYLARSGQVQRVGYGQYRYGGGLLVTADDLGGEPVRDELPDGDY